MNNDETLIRAALAEWQAAFCARDVDRLMALYAPDAVFFDAIPPFAEGVEEMRRKLVDCFRYFPETFAVESRGLTFAVGGELACAHHLWHFTDLPPGHPACGNWVRSSFTWRKQPDGRWLIIHDHCSAPFDPHTGKVVPAPADAAAGDAAAAGTCGGDANPVGWFEIYVADMGRARAFYQAVLGVELARLENPVADSPVELWAFPMQSAGYGASGALVRMEGFEAGRNSVVVYFHCADCAVEAARVGAAGGEVVRPKFAIGQYGHIALVKDTEGNLIGLHSMQ